MPKKVPRQELPDNACLTQFGEKPPFGQNFRDGLRVEIGETELSLILGEVDAMAASVLVAKCILPFAQVRVTTVGQLRTQGFVVEHSPTAANPLHVSVYAPLLPTGEHRDWDDAVAKSFRGCFTETRGGDSHERSADAGEPGVDPGASRR
jgi:hypothetical protein